MASFRVTSKSEYSNMTPHMFISGKIVPMPFSGKHMIISACPLHVSLPLFLSVSFSPSYGLSGGIFLALLHSFLLHCQAAAAVSALLPLSARNLVLLATPPLSHTLHMAVRMPCVSVCVCTKHTHTHTPHVYRSFIATLIFVSALT